jgi:hypothetical protein
VAKFGIPGQSGQLSPMDAEQLKKSLITMVIFEVMNNVTMMQFHFQNNIQN